MKDLTKPRSLMDIAKEIEETVEIVKKLNEESIRDLEKTLNKSPVENKK